MAYEELTAHCVELLQPLGAVRSRRMFGGQGIYVDDLFIAIVAFDKLFLKSDSHTRATFEASGCEPFVYDGAGKQVTVSYWTVPADAMESPVLMQPWARLAMEAALRARSSSAPKRKPVAKKAAAPAKPRKAAAAVARAKPSRRER